MLMRKLILENVLSLTAALAASRFNGQNGLITEVKKFLRLRINRGVVGSPNYCNFAYSALASFRMGMSGSASFHRARKSL